MAMELFQIFGRIALNGTDEVNNELTATTGNAEGSSNKMISAFKKVGAAVAAYFAIDKIKEFGKACVDAAADVAAEQAAFTQIMGDYSDQAQTKIDEIATATGITNSRLTPYMTSISAKFKGLGFGVEDATDLAQRGLTLAADASAFWDKSIDESVSHLNSFINGSYEGGEAIGLFANDTQMAMYAVEQGLISDTKAWANLDEATKQATRLEYAENQMALSGATGQAAKEADAYLNVQGNLNEAWRQFQATIGEPILENFVLPIMKYLADTVLPKLTTVVQGVITWVGNAWTTFKGWCGYISETFSPVFEALKTLWETLKTKIQEMIQPITDYVTSGDLATDTTNFLKDAIQFLADVLTVVITAITDFIIWLDSGSAGAEAFKAVIVGVTAAVVAWKVSMAISGLISTVKNAISGAKAAFAAFNAVLAANPIGVVITALAALVAAFMYLWNNCEAFREFWINLWETVKTWAVETWESISTFFTETWEAISTTATAIWNGITTALTKTWNTLKTTVTTVWNNIKTGISNAWNNVKATTTNVWDGIKSTVTNVWNGIKDTSTSVWNSIKTAITTPITNAKSTITTLIDGIKTKVTNTFNTVKTTVTNAWNAIKTAITTPIDAAKTAVSNAIESIKGFFNFEFKWPTLKLPHFTFTGSWNPFDWPDKFPSIGISWYAKGGILTKPTLFGIEPDGRAMVGGEAGNEAVAPIDTLLGYVKTAVAEQTGDMVYTLNKLIAMLSDYMPQILNGMDRPLVLDTGAVVGGIAKTMDSKLGDINKMRGRGN